MNSRTSNTANRLFKSAIAAGTISKAAANAIGVRDIGEEINAALGVSVDDIKASEVFILTLLLDDSSSIRFVAGNTEAIRDGHNLVIDSLAGTKQKDGIIIMGTLLNRGLLYPYTPIDKAPRLDTKNYDPSGGTPLFSKSLEVLAAVIAKAQEFEDAGVPCRTATAIVSDGADTASDATASDVKRVVESMLARENHIIAGMGIDDGQTDFKAVFGEMGIRDEWILTPKNSPSEIRRAFGTLSQSAVRASQATTFSQAAMGGFANP